MKRTLKQQGVAAERTATMAHRPSHRPGPWSSRLGFCYCEEVVHPIFLSPITYSSSILDVHKLAAEICRQQLEVSYSNLQQLQLTLFSFTFTPPSRHASLPSFMLLYLQLFLPFKVFVLLKLEYYVQRVVLIFFVHLGLFVWRGIRLALVSFG